jgi:hypothetical protein
MLPVSEKNYSIYLFFMFRPSTPYLSSHVLASTVQHLGEASATDTTASFSHREEERLGEEGKTQEAAKVVVY